MPMDSKKETAAGLESIAPAERGGLTGPASDKARSGARRPEREAGSAKAKAKPRKKRHPAVRALRWTLLKSIVPVLCILAVLGGMYIGYAVLGKHPGSEIFQIATWKHMYDLVFAG
ncbi:DNA-directed RNA polymerase subunit beta [Paenibacillus sp. GCM10023250]|uniref:DNA-directed RNA polymerase subunit beta n=1 Tax=Paenibacillus sp. GCM10023250 TaxID=3252648 RepID=UPI00361519CA